MQPLRSFLASAWASFRGQPRRTQAIIAAVSAVVLLACCGIGSAIGNAGNSTTTTGNNSTANSHTSAVTHATATPKPKPTATPTLAPLGNPYVGGPYRNFTHKYGQPFNPTDDLFYTDSSQQIIFGVKIANGIVNWLAVIQVPSDWTDAETYAECALFLPPGATAFNHAAPYTDYHSSIGEVVIMAPGGGTCTIFTPQG